MKNTKEKHGKILGRTIVKVAKDVPEDQYCSECGAPLMVVVVKAETIIEPYSGFRRFSKFNSKTGRRQYAKYWKCPEATNWLFNHHDNFDWKAVLIKD